MVEEIKKLQEEVKTLKQEVRVLRKAIDTISGLSRENLVNFVNTGNMYGK